MLRADATSAWFGANYGCAHRRARDKCPKVLMVYEFLVNSERYCSGALAQPVRLPHLCRVRVTGTLQGAP